MERFSELYFGISGAAEAIVGYYYFCRFTVKKSFAKCILSALLIVTVMQLCFGAANSVTGMISPFIIGKNPDLTAAIMILFNLISIFAVCICCEIMLKKFLNKIFNVKNNIPGIISFFIPLIMIFGVSFYIDHIFYGNTVCGNEIGKISEKAAAMFVFQILGMSAVFCIIRIFCDTVINRIETKYVRIRAENAESRCEKTKSFRHDVKNHMLVLTGFLSHGDIHGAEKYLSEMKIISDDLSARLQTGRIAADILIGNKLSGAEKMGIRSSCEIKIPPCRISDSDLCIILANAVDNAIHACEKLENGSNKFIEINGFSQGDIFLIEVKNSYDGKAFKKSTGLKNIESAAKKYGGSAKIICTENVFSLQIIMQTDISQH